MSPEDVLSVFDDLIREESFTPKEVGSCLGEFLSRENHRRMAESSVSHLKLYRVKISGKFSKSVNFYCCMTGRLLVEVSLRMDQTGTYYQHGVYTFRFDQITTTILDKETDEPIEETIFEIIEKEMKGRNYILYHYSD